MAKANKRLELLLSPPIERPHITDELAGCYPAADGAGAPEALVVSPFGKVCRVELEQDDDGVAFLGRGWPEFLAAHGIGVDWFVVVRHEGGGALTVKVFDTSCCLHEFRSPAAVSSSMANKNNNGVCWKPQFIRVMHPDFMEKMMIPAEFLKHYVTGEYLKSQIAIVLSPLGKFWRFKLEKDGSDMFFSGNWSHFVAFHGVSEGDVLLMRYEGNMVFKFKAFCLSGNKKDFKDQDTKIQQDIEKQHERDSLSFSRKRKSNDVSPCCKEKKRTNGSVSLLKKESSQKEPDYQTGPPSWIIKEITTYALKRALPLSVKFCRYVGFNTSCTITLKTEMDSTRSWKVHGLAYNAAHYLGDGWKTFCKDTMLKEGDVCTFNIVKTLLWHVTIKRSSIVTDNQEQKKSPPAHYSMHCMTKNGSSSIEEKGPDGSGASFRKIYTRSVYEIGPPSWIQKEMTISSLQKHLFLAEAFFIAIGLKEQCTITLKTSIDSTKFWQVDVLKKMNGSYKLGKDWWMFCQDNRLKEGDICTFEVVEATLWQVIITRVDKP
ncbi:hypothetical protein QOZ80_4AG0322210 [Eleusine coracana subsp. coracana]|nr:hypothetical protein QOZ80_4AG0322210 [Eleusine coracana subsp. coracana]